jgi:hypothetical protein
VREVPVFFPRGAAEHRCAPTHAVLVARSHRGMGYLGQMRFDQKLGVIEIDLDAELAVDPWLHARVNESLARTGHRSSGLFTDWTLSAKLPQTPGLRSVRVTDQKQGRLAVTLELELERASLPLWRLATAEGLPLGFRWEAGQDGAKVSGELEIPFSLARRVDHPLTLEGGELRNTSDRVVYADYVKVGDRFLFPRQPGGVVLLPKTSVTVASVFGASRADLDGASLPSTAVATETANPLDEFVQEQGLTDQLRVRNLLPAVDEKRGRSLRFVEVYVVQVREVGGVEQEVRAGPFKLAPYESDGDERSVSFLKLRGGVKYRVEARAYFSNGATDLKPVWAAGSEVNLGPSLLAEKP